MLKELSVNILILEALEKMPNYTKFMKDLVTKKRNVSYMEIGGLQHFSETIS